MNFNWLNALNPLTPEEYNLLFKIYAESKPEELTEEKRALLDYTKLNFQRSSRIEKTYSPSENIKEIINSIDSIQYWMVITENWCGDSAQNLPYIIKIASLSDKIELKLVTRDSNPAVMNQYLTNGTKSIPILIAFDSEGSEIFKWGPRPKEAQEVIILAKADGLEKNAMYEKLHLWYGRNRGAAIETELSKLIEEHTNQIIPL